MRPRAGINTENAGAHMVTLLVGDPQSRVYDYLAVPKLGIRHRSGQNEKHPNGSDTKGNRVFNQGKDIRKRNLCEYHQDYVD